MPNRTTPGGISYDLADIDPVSEPLGWRIRRLQRSPSIVNDVVEVAVRDDDLRSAARRHHRRIVAATEGEAKRALEVSPPAPLPFRMEAVTSVGAIGELLTDAALEVAPIVVEWASVDVIPGDAIRVGRLLAVVDTSRAKDV